MAEKTGASLGEIVNKVNMVSGLVEEISVASNEQADGISQVTDGLNQIDSVTQQNTSSAEETASAAAELSSQADELQQHVSLFKLRKIDDGSKSLGQASVSPQIAAVSGLSTADDVWGGAPDTQSSLNKDIISLDDDNFGTF